MHTTCVILVNYHGASDTARCIKSLRESRSPVDIVVVDNSPDDPALGIALQFASGVTILPAPKNLGFGCANNLGIEWALKNTECEYVFFLNNDATVFPDSIEILTEALEKDSNIGIVTPRIAFMHDPNLLWYGGGEVDWRRASAVTPGFNRSARADLAMTERDVTFASGCALFFRASTLRSTGGFDARFFMYEEDLELCLRASEMGFRIRYIPAALVLHRVQGSSRDKTEDRGDFWSVKNPRLTFYAYHIIRNRLLNADRHARGVQRVTVCFFFPLFLIRRAIPFALGGRFDAIWAMIVGIKDFLKTKNGMMMPDQPVR